MKTIWFLLGICFSVAVYLHKHSLLWLYILVTSYFVLIIYNYATDYKELRLLKESNHKLKRSESSVESQKDTVEFKTMPNSFEFKASGDLAKDSGIQQFASQIVDKYNKKEKK